MRSCDLGELPVCFLSKIEPLKAAFMLEFVLFGYI
jgi:hypothetical protein